MRIMCCDSYPVNSQCLTCPCRQPKLPLEKQLTAASQGMLWRPKARASIFCEGLLFTEAKEGLAKLLVSHLSSLRDATRSCIYFVSSLNSLGVALVLYLPTLFPTIFLPINQKSVRIFFQPLLPSGVPDGRANPPLPPSYRQLFASLHYFNFSFLQCSSHSSSQTLFRHHLLQLCHCPLSLHLSSFQVPPAQASDMGPGKADSGTLMVLRTAAWGRAPVFFQVFLGLWVQ